VRELARHRDAVQLEKRRGYLQNVAGETRAAGLERRSARQHKAFLAVVAGTKLAGAPGNFPDRR
jgi:hypothetical protein